MSALVAKLMASHLWRTWQNYGQRRGGVLAGGMAYAGLFSVFGALAIGLSVFAQVLGSDTGLYLRVVEAVDGNLPGLLDVGPDGGAVDPADLVQSQAWSVAGIVASALTVVAALGWLDAGREGIRAIFDLPLLPGNVVVKKLRDLGVLATLGVVILVSAVLSLAVTAGGEALLGLVGLADSMAAEALLRVLSTAVVLMVDMVTFTILFRLASHLHLPWRDLRTGVLIAAVGLGVFKQTAGLLLGSAGSGNPVLATGAVIVGLLVWLNLVSRLTLLAASWVATIVRQKQLATEPAPGLEKAQRPTPAFVGSGGRPVAVGPREPSMPSFGPRSADRTAVAAGVVLGGLGAVAVRVVAAGAASVVRSVRGR